MKHLPIYAILTTAALLPAYGSFAQDRTQDQTQSQTRQTVRDRDIYGSQLMTPQERSEYRAKMRAAKTAEERESIRADHHDRMKERAQARGVTLPDAPPAGRGPGSGAGSTRGGGMGPGPGGGMGPGMGGGGGGR